jgi:hypothetical protein
MKTIISVFILFLIVIIMNLSGCITSPVIPGNNEVPLNSNDVTYRALLVGVGKYQSSDVTDLPSVPYDVERVKQNLGLCRFGMEKIAFSSIETLTNNQASKTNILQSIDSIFSQADHNDISYFYFTGHGNYNNGLSYLCPCDVSKNPASSISVIELENALSAIPGNKVVILDSCASGGFIGKNLSSENGYQKDYNQNIIQVFSGGSLQKNLTGSQFQVITACKSDQVALGVMELKPEYSFMNINPFCFMTFFLCEACGYDILSDSYGNELPSDINLDGKVSIKEAHSYIQQQIDTAIPYLESLMEEQLGAVMSPDVQVFPVASNFTLIERNSELEEESNPSEKILTDLTVVPDNMYFNAIGQQKDIQEIILHWSDGTSNMLSKEKADYFSENPLIADVIGSSDIKVKSYGEGDTKIKVSYTYDGVIESDYIDIQVNILEYTAEEEIKNILCSFYQSISDKNWNNAKSYCFYNSDAYYDLCGLENCIESVENIIIRINPIYGKVIINENISHAEVHLIDIPSIEGYELLDHCWDSIHMFGFIVIELKKISGEWKIDIYRGDY